MKNWLTQGLGLCAVVLLSLTAACKKDETRAVLTPGAVPTLQASTTTPNLNQTTANSGTTAVTLTYSAADFGYPASTTYAVQFDKKGGTFASPVTYTGGTAAGTLSLTTSQLATVFTSLGYAFNATSQVDVRVVASVGAVAAPSVSPVVTLTATPTPLCVPSKVGSWGIIGPAADGWTTDRMLTYDCFTQTFSLRTMLSAGPFKFRADQAWTTSLGGASTTFSTGVPLSTPGTDLVLATPGTYTITLAVTSDPSGTITGGTVTIKP